MKLNDAVFVQNDNDNSIEAFLVVGRLLHPCEHNEFFVLMGEPNIDGERGYVLTDAKGAFIEDSEMQQELIDVYFEGLERQGLGYQDPLARDDFGL